MARRGRLSFGFMGVFSNCVSEVLMNAAGRFAPGISRGRRRRVRAAGGRGLVILVEGEA